MHIIEDIIGDDLYSEIKSKEGTGEEYHYSLYIHVVPKELTGHTNDKYYVGITGNDVERRWVKGRNYNTSKLKIPIKEYGWDNIEHIVISTNLSLGDVQDYESKLIAYLKTTNDQYGYNIQYGGYGHPKEYYPHLSVKQYDFDGNLVKYWDDIWDAAEYIFETGNYKSLRSIRQNIELVCCGDYKKAYKYRWTYGDKELDCTIDFKPYANQKTVYQFSLDGKLLGIFPSIMKASLELGIKPGAINMCCTGRNRTALGYYFSYDNKFVPKEYKTSIKHGVLQLTPDFVPVGQYYSVAFAQKMTGFSNESIRYVVNQNSSINDCDNYKMSNGYIWLMDENIKNNDYHYTVAQYNLSDKKIVERYHDCAEASEATGITRQDIAKCCRSNANPNKNNHHRHSFIWRYEDYDKPISECNIFLTDDLPIKEGHILPIGVTL